MFRVSWLVVISVLLDLQECFKGVPSPTVTTRSGRLRGRYVETRDGRIVEAFLGIPFAQPPVGNLRFEPPRPVIPWTHERLAVNQPLPCKQTVDLRGVEDCLFLNIYTPDHHKEYPVLVYFYGGAFELGAADGYTPEYILDEDVILVVVQSRIGLLGFFSTGDEVVPGNMGLKDQRLALRWLKDNVGAFGGDPGRVTINGLSSGAASVHILMTYAAHEDLFWAGISQSASALVTWAYHPPEEIRKMVPTIAALAGCPDDSVGLVECLRAISADELLILYDFLYKAAVYSGVEIVLSAVLPLIGAVIEPECVEDRLVTGNPWYYNTTTPWLVGTLSKEMLFVVVPELTDRTSALFGVLNLFFDYYFPLAMNYQNSLTADGSVLPPHLRDYYLDQEPISRLTLGQTIDAVSDASFAYPIYESCLRANKDHTYLYYMDYTGSNTIFPIPPDGRIGPSHAEDLFYFFPHPAAPVPDREDYLNPEDIALSKKLIKYWVNFATCLDPTPCKDSEETWEPFHPNKAYLNITKSEIKSYHPFFPDRMKFWHDQPFPNRNDPNIPPPCRTDKTGNVSALPDFN